MKKKIIILGVMTIILGTVIFFAWQKKATKTNEVLPVNYQVVIGGKTFSARAATTLATQEQGLSGFTSLSNEEGMIFLFDKAEQYAFWMKDMKFPIDVVWLKKSSANSKTFRVVGVEKNIGPETYPKSFQSPEPADAFFEINAGVLDTLPEPVVGTTATVLFGQD